MTTKYDPNQQTTNPKETGTMPPWLNRTMAWVLRSPFHRVVSNSIMLITFNGRKSGKSYTTPISYTRQGEEIIAFTHSPWWKNLRGGAPVQLRLKGKNVQGIAETVADDPTTILPYLRTHLRNVPRDARFYAVKLDAKGQPNEVDLQKAAHDSVLIRITIPSKEQAYAMA
jgi:hypothetical protein